MNGSQTQSAKERHIKYYLEYDVIYTWHSGKDKTSGSKSRAVAGCQELWVGEGDCLQRTQKNFLKWQKCLYDDCGWLLNCMHLTKDTELYT